MFVYKAHTERLNVFWWDLQISRQAHLPRRLYAAYSRQHDITAHLVTATVLLPVPSIMPAPLLEWIETSTPYRRQHYALELLRFIKTQLGALEMQGVTTPGRALVRTFTAERSPPNGEKDNASI